MKHLIKYTFLLFLLVGCKSIQVDSSTKFIKHSNKNIAYQGRIGQDTINSASEIYWSGTSIKINFEGTSVSAILEDQNGSNYFNIIIDGSKFETLKLDKGKKTYLLTENLERGKHSIELTKRNEWTYGKTLFYGFEIDGKLLDPDPKKELFIEFYGDSITAGHGNEDYSGDDKPDGNVTNNYNTYAAITAREFNADYTCIARGGIGVMVSWFNMIMSEMYDRLDPADENSKWDFSIKEPDIVVVNLFQNDSWIVNHPKNEEFIRRFGKTIPNKEKIVADYTSFIKQIREEYSNASIVCLMGNMDITKEGSEWPSYVKEAVRELKDGNIYTCIAPYKNTPGHPKVEEHKAIVNKLIETIKEHKLK